MSSEPLKGKERVIQYVGNIRRMDGGIHRIPFIKRGFLTDDVKSAVQGLLKSIKDRKECVEADYQNGWLSQELREHIIAEIEMIENDIKKWFADVINKEGEE